jgi:hypothetical protein
VPPIIIIIIMWFAKNVIIWIQFVMSYVMSEATS